ncbi:MAG: hypothetical protein N4A35_12325 [Flavobacteriales bacterium]|nr:hypothetical protein [Flavobacteriales bacterium]
MKLTLTIYIILLLEFSSWGQDFISSIATTSITSKVIVLITLAAVAIHNYIKWLNENKRTDP